MIVDDAYALQILKIGTMTPALRLDVPILVGSSTLCVEDPAIVEARSVYLYCCGRNFFQSSLQGNCTIRVMTDISIVLNIRDVKHSLRAAMSLALCSRDSMLNGTNSPMGSVCSRSRHLCAFHML